jgi:hypothetical protein
MTFLLAQLACEHRQRGFLVLRFPVIAVTCATTLLVMVPTAPPASTSASSTSTTASTAILELHVVAAW